MSLKIKISILAIFFALLAAVCVGFAFAAPSEKLNLKGTLSYEVAKATISVSPNISTLGSTTGSGSTTGLGSETGSGEYVIGETVTLTATPLSGSNSSFLAWATSLESNEMEILSITPTYSFKLSSDSPTTYFALFNSTETEQTVEGLKYTIYEDAELAAVTDTTSTELSSVEILPEVQNENNSYKVFSIGTSAFAQCSKLTEIIIPEGIRVIGEEAFNRCSSLTSVSLPSTLTSISETAFVGGKIENFIGEGNDYYLIDDGRAIIADGGKTLLVYAAGNKLASYEIPDGVTKIGYGAFYMCYSLTSISLPSTLTSIGEIAFFYCSGLTSIKIPDGVTEIAAGAFAYTPLTSITIPEGVTSLADTVFMSCIYLTSVTLPSTLTSFGRMPFYYCTNLRSFKGAGNDYYTIDNSGRALLVDGGKTLLAYAIGNTASFYQIPEGVTRLGDYSFYSCKTLASVSIPKGVTSIGEFAFAECKGLTSITIPEGVTEIGEYAFRQCTNLTSVSLPSSLTTISNSVFDVCSGLTQITINGDITTLGSNAFSACTKLTKLTLGAKVTSIPSNLFTDNNLTRLTEIVVEEGSTLSAALPTYGTWVKDGGGSETVKNFSEAGTYSTTKPA